MPLSCREGGEVRPDDRIIEGVERGRSGGFLVPDLADFTWFEVVLTRDGDTLDELANLGGGERQSILVARERHADRVILDDLEARRRAASLGLQLTSTRSVWNWTARTVSAGIRGWRAYGRRVAAGSRIRLWRTAASVTIRPRS